MHVETGTDIFSWKDVYQYRHARFKSAFKNAAHARQRQNMSDSSRSEGIVKNMWFAGKYAQQCCNESVLQRKSNVNDCDDCDQSYRDVCIDGNDSNESNRNDCDLCDDCNDRNDCDDSANRFAMNRIAISARRRRDLMQGEEEMWCIADESLEASIQVLYTWIRAAVLRWNWNHLIGKHNRAAVSKSTIEEHRMLKNFWDYRQGPHSWENQSVGIEAAHDYLQRVIALCIEQLKCGDRLNVPSWKFGFAPSSISSIHRESVPLPAASDSSLQHTTTISEISSAKGLATFLMIVPLLDRALLPAASDRWLQCATTMTPSKEAHTLFDGLPVTEDIIPLPSAASSISLHWRTTKTEISPEMGVVHSSMTADPLQQKKTINQISLGDLCTTSKHLYGCRSQEWIYTAIPLKHVETTKISSTHWHQGRMRKIQACTYLIHLLTCWLWLTVSKTLTNEWNQQ